jgi:nucleoside-diphosphate-sugar epimerase
MPVSVRDDINLNGIRNLALAAVKNKVRCFIYASSVCAYEPEFVRGKDCVKEEYPIGKGASPIYYCNSKAIAEKILREFIGSSGVKLTIFRPCIIVGPHDHVIVRNFRENAAKFLGRDPRLQFVHEDDVAAAFLQAIHTNMPGAYNVVPDDFIRLSDVYEAIGLKFVLTLPLCLARFVTAIRWRFFGSSLHSSWLDCAVSDTTYSNAKLKATGWYPRHTSAQALHTAIERFETLSM